MKKTYWWRILSSFLGGITILVGWLYDSYICFPNGSGECVLDQFRLSIIYPVVLFSISSFVVSTFLFFVRDEVFRKWLWLALIWFGITIFLIVLAPEYAEGIYGMMNPTKETVSLGMSVLFIPVSLGKLLWDSKRKV
ncbi:MAG: hypothetical protein HGA31_05520 [Candidatus Moranbacteria bacterium]|nr:hypothetical protein [Candidatus Moranbacteria bacterium]